MDDELRISRPVHIYAANGPVDPSSFGTKLTVSFVSDGVCVGMLHITWKIPNTHKQEQEKKHM